MTKTTVIEEVSIRPNIAQSEATQLAPSGAEHSTTHTENAASHDADAAKATVPPGNKPCSLINREVNLCICVYYCG